MSTENNILVRLKDNNITVRPIAGTRKRGKDEIEDKFVINEMSKANIVYFSGGNPQHLINSISVNSFLDELLRIKKNIL